MTTKRSISTILPTSIHAIGSGINLQPGSGSGGKKQSGGTGRSDRSGGAVDWSAAAPVNYAGQFQSLLKGLYETVFASQPVSYQQATGDALREQVASWLRPGYEQAINNRVQQTGRANAELDADAIARGMGASTFVTDVKSRNLRDEAKDVALLEGEYGATLAKNVAEQLTAERERALEAELFNREQEQTNYQMAYDAAELLLGLGGNADGLDTAMRRSQTVQGAATAPTAGAAQAGQTAGATSAQNCASFLARLSPAQRASVYTGTDAESARYRGEIIASVGLDGFYSLQNRYGA